VCDTGVNTVYSEFTFMLMIWFISVVKTGKIEIVNSKNAVKIVKKIWFTVWVS